MSEWYVFECETPFWMSEQHWRKKKFGITFVHYTIIRYSFLPQIHRLFDDGVLKICASVAEFFYCIIRV